MTQVTEGPTTERLWTQLGVVAYANKTIVVLTGGGQNDTKSMILNLKTNKLIDGPDLPHPVEDGTVVQFKDSFLILGGNSKNIISYSPKKNEFILMPMKLNKKIGSLAAAVLIPDEMCE